MKLELDNGLRVLILAIAFFVFVGLATMAEQFSKPRDALSICVQRCWTQVCVLQCGEAVAKASCK